MLGLPVPKLPPAMPTAGCGGSMADGGQNPHPHPPNGGLSGLWNQHCLDTETMDPGDAALRVTQGVVEGLAAPIPPTAFLQDQHSFSQGLLLA